MDKQQLQLIRQLNNKAAWIVSDWISNSPDAISKSTMEIANEDGDIPEDILYTAVFLQFQGLDQEEEALLSDYYFREGIHKLDPKEYLSNPYLTTIKFPKAAIGSWKFTFLEYKPYESFICNDILLKSDFREIPQMGFFDCSFRFPAVLQDDREWMAVKPSEIESMKDAIATVKGKVVTFGLGLGYFTFMVSRKPDIESITVVERDLDAIRLFQKHILPQFPNRNKVRIIRSDAFDYMDKAMKEENYDYAFVDLWHDISDGLSSYLRTKRREHLCPSTKFLYWVEESLLSSYRWTVFDSIIEENDSAESVLAALSDDKLRERIGQ